MRDVETPSRGRTSGRGQANVIGVAVLLGIAVVSMGALTAAVGTVVDATASEADAERAASDLDDAFQPVATTGTQHETVTFSAGRLAPVDRTLEVRADGEVVHRLAVDALVFTSGDRRVAFHAGAVVRGEGESAWLAADPPITVGQDIVVIGATRLGDDVGSISGSGGVTAMVETDVVHDRRDLGVATFSVAVETPAPGAWERAFHERGASVEREPGSPPTVVATFEGDRQGYLVVHDLNAEVSGRE